ncbi:MAG: hypothetical protein F6K42_32985, partial [Leptolyngbya sp. SIO1D8]|nr:hypothetical protein [Leptolyngbya sp. SIO1D8]
CYVKQVRLYSYQGYQAEQLAAIASCSYLKGVARGYDLSLSMMDLGSTEHGAKEWISTTPFFLSRFPVVRRGKPRMLTEQYQKDCPEHQVLRYLQFLPWLGLEGEAGYQEQDEGLGLYLQGQLAAVAACKPFPKFWEWTAERHQGRKVGRMGYCVHLKFAAPVVGPIIMGYAAHYGLGAMRPVREWGGVQQPFGQDACSMGVLAC